MSFAVSAVQSICRSGTLMPLRLLRPPPTSTRHCSSSGETRLVTRSRIAPSSSLTVMPSVSPPTIAVCSLVRASTIRPPAHSSPSEAHSASVTVEPAGSGIGSAFTFAQRNLGPCRSPSSSTGFLSSAETLRIIGTSASNWPPCRCDELRRKTLTPARMSLRIMGSSNEAGPSVATIFVRRAVGSGLACAETSAFMSNAVTLCFCANAEPPSMRATETRRVEAARATATRLGACAAWNAWQLASSAKAMPERLSVLADIVQFANSEHEKSNSSSVSKAVLKDRDRRQLGIAGRPA